MFLHCAEYLEVQAYIKDWPYAIVNDVSDKNGDLIPCRQGNAWCPVIRLIDGCVMGWPQGIKANISYKVRDMGEYWLQDSQNKRIAKWTYRHVPNDFLCHGDNGYSDYILLKVDADGLIIGWKKPCIVDEEWRDIAMGVQSELEEMIHKFSEWDVKNSFSTENAYHLDDLFGKLQSQIQGIREKIFRDECAL
jgi:hypothetical protein